MFSKTELEENVQYFFWTTLITRQVGNQTTSYPGLLFPLISGWETSDPGKFRLEVRKFRTSGWTAHAYLTNTLAVVLLPLIFIVLIFIVFKTIKFKPESELSLVARFVKLTVYSLSIFQRKRRESESTRRWGRGSGRGVSCFVINDRPEKNTRNRGLWTIHQACALARLARHESSEEQDWISNFELIIKMN